MNFIDNILQPIKIEPISLDNMSEELFAMYVWKMLKQENKNILLVTPTLLEANKLFQKIGLYTENAYLFPMDDFLTSEAIAVSPDLLITRLETLKEISLGKPLIIITHLMGYLHFLPTKENYDSKILSLTVNMEISRDDLINKLLLLGYKRETIVTKTGEIGVRGFIVDIFPLGEIHPIRIEFFGDSIESIRTFDENNQRSLEHKKQITIYPCTEFLINELIEEEKTSKTLEEYIEVSSIQDYLKQPIVIYKDIHTIKNVYETTKNEVLDYIKEQSIKPKRYFFPYEEKYLKNSILYFSLDSAIEFDKKIISFNTKNPPQFYENIETIEKYLKDELANGKTIIISIKEYQQKNLRNKIKLPSISTTLENIVSSRINYISLDMESGFIYKDYIFLTANELFHNRTLVKKYKTNFKYGTKITDINKLEIGDYVVHQSCGIGIYNGLKTLKQGNQLKDYVEVLYQDKDKLYIPVEKIDLLLKYSSKEGVVPKIYKLGGSQWQKVKNRVKTKVHDMALDLLRIQSERESQKGFAFLADDELQKQFEDSFSYQPTKDQLTATSQIKNDMEAPHPMDRLLIGDVGFGKTEVAFRAIFKAILSQKQVLFLCPTTILSNQHYETALERFSSFPIKIGLLNRFTSSKETTRIINSLKDGTIDLVIGTHRLLSDDIKPKDLGLLVVDEEQRFGVKQKEKLKMYKSNIDVLTLTATPIPRTLQLSITGLRSMSLIETPPVNRYPVQTYVLPTNKTLIKEAINKELARSGQVFILYNHVKDINEKVDEIGSLVKDARVLSAHGQMDKNEIEDKMMKFIKHEADVLVCTTIIETGIDMPNVNTLIILDADHFGLSQLYQIRGRVGRSNKIAYCYLMYQEGKLLSSTATKRLKVIKDFTSLGSGFAIATRDLSIRGAGDILGSEQAGFIDSVGIDLYLKMLEEETKKLKGEEILEEETSQTPLISVSTHISDSYVKEEELKIEIHRIINRIDSKEKLLATMQELEDRFGKIDEDIIVYMYEEWFEKLVKKLDIKKVYQTKNTIEITISAKKIKDGESLFKTAFNISPMFRFKSTSDNVTIVLDTIKLEKHPIFYLTELLSTLITS